MKGEESSYSKEIEQRNEWYHKKSNEANRMCATKKKNGLIT